MPSMFVVCGEALMDVFVQATTATGLMLDARIGGSPLNVATGLARMGCTVAFISGVSTDAAGERVLQHLQTEGVDTRLLVRSAAPTTLGMVSHDATTGVPHYTFYGQGTACRAIDSANLPALPAEAEVLQFGSYALVVEPTASALRAMAGRHAGRLLIAYDPNVRLNVEPDLDRWRDVVEAMAALAQLIKVSDEDLRLLYPGTDLQVSAQRWLAGGARLVVVTRGGSGCEAFTARSRCHVPATAVDVVDTVGAGDTFQAALLTWLDERGLLGIEASALWAETLNDFALKSLLQFASAAAAITCSRRGADLPRRAELPAARADG